MRIAFLGTGRMGTELALHLLPDHELTVWNRTASRTQRLAEAGAAVAGTAAEAVAGAELVVTSLFGPDAVRETVTVPSLIPGGVTWVDTTTVSPADAEGFADAVPSYVGAPVVGTLGPARNGSLGVYVGSPDDGRREQVLELVAPWADPERLRGVGSGREAAVGKLLANLALAVSAVGVFLAVVSVAHGIPDLEWIRRLVRLGALAALIGCIAGRRLDLRSVLWGLLAAMAVNVPLFYAGVVPAPYGSYLTGFLGDKNVAGLYYAAMPVLAVAFVRSPQRRVMVLAAAAPCVFLTGSRTSMAGFACAVLWMWLTPRLGPVFRILILAAMGWAVTFAEENLAQLSVFGDRTGTDQLRSWIQDATAVKAAEKQGLDPLPAFTDAVRTLWPDESRSRTVRWPLLLRVGYTNAG